MLPNLDLVASKSYAVRDGDDEMAGSEINHMP